MQTMASGKNTVVSDLGRVSARRLGLSCRVPQSIPAQQYFVPELTFLHSPPIPPASALQMKLAIQAAISEAFKAPEVMKLFALNQPKQLRELMDQIKRDKVLGKHSLEKSDGEILECIMALKKLGEELTPEEAKFLQDNQTRAMSLFEEVDDDQEAKVD